MDLPSLRDPAVFLTDEVLAANLGKAKAAFDALFSYNHLEHPDFDEGWKYYNDGKSWLLKVSCKKKTLFWLFVGDRFFRTTFYLASKTKDAILCANLPEGLKAQYLASEDRKLHGISLVVKTRKDVQAYKQLLAIKLGHP